MIIVEEIHKIERFDNGFTYMQFISFHVAYSFAIFTFELMKHYDLNYNRFVTCAEWQCYCIFHYKSSFFVYLNPVMLICVRMNVDIKCFRSYEISSKIYFNKYLPQSYQLYHNLSGEKRKQNPNYS